MVYNEKKTPHYKLSLIKNLISQKKYQITHTAINNAMCDFNINAEEILSHILQIENSCFYKSMTSEYDNKIWQDVYHLKVGKYVAYIKLQIVSDEGVIIQFKRK